MNPVNYFEEGDLLVDNSAIGVCTKVEEEGIQVCWMFRQRSGKIAYEYYYSDDFWLKCDPPNKVPRLSMFKVSLG
jgi:hypothetical protein